MKFVAPAAPQADPARILELDHLLADARWEPLLDLLPDAIVLVDRMGFVRYLNSAAENATELLRVEVVGRPLRDLVRQAKVDCDVVLESFADGNRVNRLVVNRLRKSYMLSTRSVRDWNGELTCFLIVLRDLDQMPRAGSEGAPEMFREARHGSSLEEDAEDSMVLCDTTSPLMQRGLRALELGSRLLLLGESGVGKTQLARVLHRLSGPAGRPLIHVNCGSIPESLFESEMFGYERGSFTGASSKGKKGLVEAAEGGILFLDEIGEIPLSSQAKMLQFLEYSAVQRVGATNVKRLRVQVIAATNRDLREMLSAGTLRRDLYYRLSVVTLTLPPLRECPEVIEKLIDRFLERLNRRRKVALRIDNGSRRRLRSYGFPGNVRELQNLIEHLAVVCEKVVTEGDLERALSDREDPDREHGRTVDPVISPPLPESAADPHVAQAPEGQAASPAEPLREAVRRFEARVIRETIKRAGSKRKAAELLGVDIATVVRKSRSLEN